MEPSIEITYDPTIKVRGITEELFKQQPEGKFVLKPFTLISKKVYKNFTDNGLSFRYLIKFLKKKYRKDNNTILKIFSLPARFQKLNLNTSILNYFLEITGLILLVKPFEVFFNLQYIGKADSLVKKILTIEQKKKLNPLKYISITLILEFLLINFLIMVTNPKSSFNTVREFQNTYQDQYLLLTQILSIIIGIFLSSLVAIFFVLKRLPSSIGKLYKTYFITRNLFYTIEKAKAEKNKKTIVVLNLDLYSYFDEKSTLTIIGYALHSSNNYENIFIIINAQNNKFISLMRTGFNPKYKDKISFLLEDIGLNDEIEIINNDDLKEEFFPISYNDHPKHNEELRKKNAQLERENKEQLARIIQSAKLESMNIATSGLAHEIRNPLGIIQLVIENLRIEKNLNKESLIEDLDKIKTQVARIYKLTETFQKYSSKGNLTPKSIDSQITNSIRFFEQRLLSNKIEVNYDKPSDNVAKILFSEELSIVIENLISNSIDALEGNKDATITIQITKDNNQLQILFTDNGHGFSEDIKKEIFTPLFTTKGPGKGTGLGLWLCHTIVKDSLKGDIRVDSKLDEGTTFTILLPVDGDLNV